MSIMKIEKKTDRVPIDDALLDEVNGGSIWYRSEHDSMFGIYYVIDDHTEKIVASYSLYDQAVAYCNRNGISTQEVYYLGQDIYEHVDGINDPNSDYWASYTGGVVVCDPVFIG